MGENSDLAEWFFTATAANDAEALRTMLTSGFVLSQNGGPPVDIGGLLAMGLAVKAAVPDFRYGNAVRSDTQDGFVEEHDVLGTGPDGEAFSVPVCVVASITEGKITNAREYFDTAAAAPLLKALGM